MPNVAVATAETSALFDRLATLPNAPLTNEQRRAALERFLALPSGRERAGRFWRIDFETLVPDIARLDLNPAIVTVDNPNPAVVVYDLATAARECPQLLARAFGATGVHATKFGALTAAFAHVGCFIHVPADRACDHP
ncbi:MAG TPA: hypothetical protein VGI15_01710, partial [Candidatus Cybelea sp.]